MRAAILIASVLAVCLNCGQSSEAKETGTRPVLVIHGGCGVDHTKGMFKGMLRSYIYDDTLHTFIFEGDISGAARK